MGKNVRHKGERRGVGGGRTEGRVEKEGAEKRWRKGEEKSFGALILGGHRSTKGRLIDKGRSDFNVCNRGYHSTTQLNSKQRELQGGCKEKKDMSRVRCRC